MNSRDQFLARRRAGIGGSDIAAILGLSPWRTPHDVWLDKVGQTEPGAETEPMFWGTRLENVVAEVYAERSGHRVQRVNAQLVHPEHAFAVANIDRAIVNPEIAGLVRWKDGRLTTDRILECKTANGFAAREWGEPGSDAVPEHYLVQCQWYAGVTGARVVDLAVLIGGSDFRTYTIERDDLLIADMLDAGAEFWSLVQAGTPPDPKTAGDCARRWPASTPGREVIVDTKVARCVEQLRALADERKALDAREDELKAVLMAAMGNAEVATHGGERIATWKTQTARRLDSTRLRAELPDVADRFTKTTSSRVLRVAA